MEANIEKHLTKSVKAIGGKAIKLNPDLEYILLNSRIVVKYLKRKRFGYHGLLIVGLMLG